MTPAAAQAKIDAIERQLRSGKLGRWAREKLIKEIWRLIRFIAEQRAKETIRPSELMAGKSSSSSHSLRAR